MPGREENVLGVWGMVKVPAWLTYEHLSSNQLLLIGGGLLVVAAILMGLRRRKTRVVLDNSVVTEELLIYLARIATALERPTGPSEEQVTAAVLRRLEEIAKANANAKGNVKEMPFSMFGREYKRE